MLITFFKRNSILLVYSGVFILLVALVLFELDKGYYQPAKKTIITDNSYRFLTKETRDARVEIIKSAETWFNDRSEASRQELERKIDELLNQGNILFRIAAQPKIQDPGQETPRSGRKRGDESYLVDRRDPEKVREHNRFSNSLFLRDFKVKSAIPIERLSDGLVQGLVYVFFTTPLGDPEIEELTRKYRWYAAFIVLVMTLLAVALARSLLLPLRNVMNSIEESTPAQTKFIHNARSRLAVLYNRMALDAVIARLQGQLREEIARRPQMTGWEVVQFICEAFRVQINAALVACLEMVAEGPGRLRPTGQRVLAGRPDWTGKAEDLAGLIDQSMPRDGRVEVTLPLEEVGLLGEALARLLVDPERTGIRYLFTLADDSKMNVQSFTSLQTMMARLTELVEAGLQTLTLRNRLLVQERGRASISLSRNLGHDLTNIIATSKLELMALDRLMGSGDLPEEGPKREMLLESLQGMLRSVTFMQETVNLYRAYAFLQHPVLETHDGNQLISDTLDLFGLSISAKIRLLRELDPKAPRCVVDPRLIKLALFNQFQNALEAIRKKDPEQTAGGWIKVITTASREGGLRMAIEDSGTGILNSAGQPAEPHEIEKIFELGYTSYRASGSRGEGLGLNWVRTIIQDLHGGSIFAENADGGGARLVMIFPPIDQAPDLESTEAKAAEYMRRIQGQATPGGDADAG